MPEFEWKPDVIVELPAGANIPRVFEDLVDVITQVVEQFHGGRVGGYLGKLEAVDDEEE